MDICTLTIMTTMNLIGCMKNEECFIKENVKFCVPAHVIACDPPKPYYECKRDDGSSYILNEIPK